MMIALHSIIITRKFAGPIFVIRRHLKRAQNGELSRINLRKTDYLHDIKDLLNDHFDTLADKMTQMRVSLESIEEQLERLLKENKSDFSPESKTVLSNIYTQICELNKTAQQTWHYSE